ncbi:nuclear transport factor 2 family protein [Novosphingobium malaysiense]|nr:nuclear transport factor 2 family protein [Novosphingobium malaysiense]
MTFTGLIDDRLAIREFYEAFCDVAMQRNRKAWLENYTLDAVWDTGTFRACGREAIGQQYDAIMQTFERVFYTTQMRYIEVDGDRARCGNLCSERIEMSGGGIILTGAQHDDELVRDSSGVWRFAARVFQLLHVDHVSPVATP